MAGGTQMTKEQKHHAPTQPEWVCSDCGDDYGNREHGLACWHKDNCGVCGKFADVTEPRDFGYLKHEWILRASAEARKPKETTWCEHRLLADGTCALCGFKP